MRYKTKQLEYKTKQLELKAWLITNVSPMTDDGGRDITIDFGGIDSKRHAGPQHLRMYEPQIGDYWVEYETVAMPWNKEEFEKRHIKMEG